MTALRTINSTKPQTHQATLSRSNTIKNRAISAFNQQQSTLRKQLNQKIKESDLHIKPSNPQNTQDLAESTKNLIESQRKKEMPLTGLLLKFTDPTQSQRKKHLSESYRSLAHSLKTKAPDIVLNHDTKEALKAYRNYTQSGAHRHEFLARQRMTGAVNVVRDLSVTAASAMAGPKAGAAMAALTQGFDRLAPGPQMIRANTLEDATNIASTSLAMKVPDMAHPLADKAAALLQQRLLPKLPWTLRKTLTTPAAQKVGKLVSEIGVHATSDIAVESSGVALSHAANQSTPETTVKETQKAAQAAGAASIISSTAVETAVRQLPFLPRSHVVMVAETFERVGAKAAIKSQQSNQTTASSNQPPKKSETQHGMNTYGLIALEIQNRYLFPNASEPIKLLHKIQSQAVRSDARYGVGALPASGMFSNEQQIEKAINTILAREPNPTQRIELLKQMIE